MLTTSDIGSLYLDYIEENVIKPFLMKGKNSNDSTQIINYISNEIMNPYRVIPYEFYPVVGIESPSTDLIYCHLLDRKLIPLIPIISNFDWLSYQYDLSINFDETITDNGSGTNFSMTEVSPITASRSINTPHSKVDNNATNQNTRKRDYTDPRYAFERLKSINEFKYLLIRINSAIESIFKEFNTIF